MGVTLGFALILAVGFHRLTTGIPMQKKWEKDYFQSVLSPLHQEGSMSLIGFTVVAQYVAWHHTEILLIEDLLDTRYFCCWSFRILQIHRSSFLCHR